MKALKFHNSTCKVALLITQSVIYLPYKHIHLQQLSFKLSQFFIVKYTLIIIIESARKWIWRVFRFYLAFISIQVYIFILYLQMVCGIGSHFEREYRTRKGAFRCPINTQTHAKKKHRLLNLICISHKTQQKPILFLTPFWIT